MSKRSWLYWPTIASAPFSGLAIFCGYNALWYGFAPQAAAARADHPYVPAFTQATFFLSALRLLLSLLRLVYRESSRAGIEQWKATQ
jgi:hypothetical protein